MISDATAGLTYEEKSIRALYDYTPPQHAEPYLLDDRSENAPVALVVNAISERKIDGVVLALPHTWHVEPRANRHHSRKARDAPCYSCKCHDTQPQRRNNTVRTPNFEATSSDAIREICYMFHQNHGHRAVDQTGQHFRQNVPLDREKLSSRWWNQLHFHFKFYCVGFIVRKQTNADIQLSEIAMGYYPSHIQLIRTE